MSTTFGVAVRALYLTVQSHVAEDDASPERVQALVDDALRRAALADAVNRHRAEGCSAACPSAGCTMVRALAMADESAESILHANLTPHAVDGETWFDSTSAAGEAVSPVEEALMYASQRGLLHRLPSAPQLVRVVLIEPRYQSEGGAA